MAAMHDYFMKMKDGHSEFFYVMPWNEKGRLRDVFWPNARSRSAFKELGDDVTI